MRRILVAVGAVTAVLAAAVLPAQADEGTGKTVTVGCGPDRAKELHQALLKTAPMGQPVTVHLSPGCRYTYPENKVQFAPPSGRTIIGHGAVLEGRTKMRPVLTSLTSGSRITVEDVTLTGPEMCVRVPSFSHFTFKNVKMHCSTMWSAMDVADEATADLLGETELRGNGKAPYSGGSGLLIKPGGTVHMRDTALITNYAVSTRMVNLDPVGGYDTPRTPGRSYHVSGNGAGVMNYGTLTVENQARITGNKIIRSAEQPKYRLAPDLADTYQGAGIYNAGGASATVVPGSVTGNQPDQCAGPTPVTGCTN